MEHNLFALWHYVDEPRHAKRAVNRSSFTPKPRAEQMPGPARLSVPVFRQKTCAKAKGGCGEKFKPARAMQMACSPDCAWSMARHEGAKKAAVLARDDKARTRVALEAIKTVPTLKKEAQKAFNAWVRGRDAALPCISCGAPPPDLSGLHAGRDCGHYRSTGSADHLRYTEDNAAGQCVRCNQWGAGKAVEYRIGLIARIGRARVEALESNNTPVKWTRDGLREIRDRYRAKAARLRKGME